MKPFGDCPVKKGGFERGATPDISIKCSMKWSKNVLTTVKITCIQKQNIFSSSQGIFSQKNLDFEAPIGRGRLLLSSHLIELVMLLPNEP